MAGRMLGRVATWMVGTFLIGACTVDRTGDLADEGAASSAGGGGGANGAAVTSPAAVTAGVGPASTTTVTSGAGGSGASGAGGDTSASSSGGAGGGAPVPVDECAEDLDDCLRGERCMDLEVGFDCSPVTILILEESDDSKVVAETLTTLGADVVEGPEFGDWDGTNPTLAGMDALVWFEGADWYRFMPLAGQTAIADHVAAGGGLVRTAFGASNAYGASTPAQPILPVTYDLLAGSDATWTRDAPHFIGESLASGFRDDVMGWSKVKPRDGAVVIWHDDADNPLVATTDAFVGRVVYVNHDVTYGGPIGAEATTIFADAALWAAGLGR